MTRPLIDRSDLYADGFRAAGGAFRSGFAAVSPGQRPRARGGAASSRAFVRLARRARGRGTSSASAVARGFGPFGGGVASVGVLLRLRFRAGRGSAPRLLCSAFGA